ncbi:MAG: fasciclin domain-containing protein, partial [Robiginitalea sp.]
MKFLKSTLFLALIGAVSAMNAQGSVMTSATEASNQPVRIEVQTPTIVGVASSNEVFSTLVTAVAAADLVG